MFFWKLLNQLARNMKTNNTHLRLVALKYMRCWDGENIFVSHFYNIRVKF